jgi:Uma2 family endonuclease
MNLQLRPADFPMTTQGAEGLARRCWTVAEIEAMVTAGIIDEDERFELIDGEVVPMSPKGIRHEMVKGSLNKFWTRKLSDAFNMIPETTFRLNKSSFVEPDFVFFSNKYKLPELKPRNALLAVEVSDSTLRYDMGRKADIYARHGVALLWVIDVETLQTHVFSKPSADGFLERHVVEANEILAPHFAPEIALKMAELPLI